MTPVALRVMFVVVAATTAIILLVAPWRTDGRTADRASEGIVDSTGKPVSDADGFEAVPGFETGAGPQHMVRYQMPEASSVPPLPKNVTALEWTDLWAEGTLEMDAAGRTRIGTPGENLFPEDTTAEDVMLFFLDLEDMRDLQPNIGTIRPELDGKRVRLAGYTTPVGFAEDARSFLLVPELGACIHVPPPPPNQIVYVEQTEGAPQMFAPVWVTGTLRADPVPTILADVGYRLEDVVAQPYH